MEAYNLKEDIKVFCVTAKSFPEGIQEAFLTLEQMLSKEGRTFYGISHGSKNGEIIYKAAVSESFEGEATKLGFETFTITKGNYITETIFDWMSNVATIGTTFQRLLAHPLLDRTGACVEWYKNDKEVLCMVKINS